MPGTISTCPLCHESACSCHADLATVSNDVAQALADFRDHPQLPFKESALALLATLRPYFLAKTDADILEKPFKPLLGDNFASAKALMWMHEGREVREEPLFSDNEVAEIMAGVYPHATLRPIVADKEIFADTLLGIYRADGTAVFERSFRDIP